VADFDITGAQEDDAFSTDKTPAPTVLDAIKADLQAAVKNDPITLSVPKRERWTIRYNANVSADMMARWRKAARDKTMADGFDGMKYACLILANQCEVAMFDGQIATDDLGNELNFRNMKFLEMIGAARAIDAVRKFYGVDGDILRAVEAILVAAGYDSEEQEAEADPTLLA